MRLPDSELLDFLQQALRVLASAPPIARAHLQAVKDNVALAWLQYAEATASAAVDIMAEPAAMPGCQPWQATASLPTWTIATFERMEADDPLWSCTFMLLRALLTAASRPPPGSGAAPRHAVAPATGTAEALRLVEAVPLPFGGAARAFRERFSAQLRHGARAAIIESLFAANELLSPVERPMACWIPCLVALREGSRGAAPEAWVLALLDFITAHAKQQLSKLPPSIATTWLVGRDPFERCAARLLALLLMRRGTICYPWTSAAPPRFGRYLMASIGAAGPLGGQPANCLGMIDLVAEAQQNHALARAAALWDADGAGTPFTALAQERARAGCHGAPPPPPVQGCSSCCPSGSAHA